VVPVQPLAHSGRQVVGWEKVLLLQGHTMEVIETVESWNENVNVSETVALNETETDLEDVIEIETGTETEAMNEIVALNDSETGTGTEAVNEIRTGTIDRNMSTS
jgi:hypothetical protein